MMSDRKLVLYIAMSVDGYIAGPGGDMGFLKAVEKEGEDYGYGEFISGIDTVLIGRKTYEWVVNEVGQYPMGDREVFVISRQIVGNAGNAGNAESVVSAGNVGNVGNA